MDTPEHLKVRHPGRLAVQPSRGQLGLWEEPLEWGGGRVCFLSYPGLLLALPPALVLSDCFATTPTLFSLKQTPLLHSPSTPRPTHLGGGQSLPAPTPHPPPQHLQPLHLFITFFSQGGGGLFSPSFCFGEGMGMISILPFGVYRHLTSSALLPTCERQKGREKGRGGLRWPNNQPHSG